MALPSASLLEIEDLEGRIEQALMSFEPVRSSQVPLQLQVGAFGDVRLEGWVRSRVIKDAVEDIVRHVPGVAKLDLSLVVDPELEVDVASALARSAATADLEPGDVIIRADFGTVRLVGSVASSALRDSVAQVASQVDGVRRIENELQVRDSVGKK
jgi:osmotically-inducible protein OsmY